MNKYFYLLLCIVTFWTLTSDNKITSTQKNYPIETNSKKRCSGCALQNGEIEYIGGVIASSNYFEAYQDYVVPIPGFIIINSKRHVQSLDEFTQEERTDFIEFLYKMRKGMQEALDIKTIYIIQEEDSSHFHVWLFPRYEWMEQFGKKIKSVKPIMKWAQRHLKIKENLKTVEEMAIKIRCAL